MAENYLQKATQIYRGFDAESSREWLRKNGMTEIAKMLLMGAGFEIDTAMNGREAVDKVAAASPGTYSAVLMDIQMPEMSGYEATQAIRALPGEQSKVPILAMTANAFSEDVAKAKEVGMNGHIAKPIDIPQMMRTLAEVIKSEG